MEHVCKCINYTVFIQMNNNRKHVELWILEAHEGSDQWTNNTFAQYYPIEFSATKKKYCHNFFCFCFTSQILISPYENFKSYSDSDSDLNLAIVRHIVIAQSSSTFWINTWEIRFASMPTKETPSIYHFSMLIITIII